MKIKSVIALVLTVVCLLPIVTGVSFARQNGLNYKVYLPLVAKPPCVPTKPTVYIAISDPIVRVGEIVTATGAIVNDCTSLVGHPWFGVATNPTGILSVTSPLTNYLQVGVPIGGYVEDQITMLATGSGVVTMTMWVNYETVDDTRFPPWFYYDNAGSSPTAIRVLPNP
jgi:hypothetical protein